MQHLTQFFRILSTASLILSLISGLFFTKFAFASDIFIVARVNQNIITNIDIDNRLRAFEIYAPEVKDLTQKEKNHYAVQSLIRDELRFEYAKRANVKLTKEQRAAHTKDVLANLHQKGVQNVKAFAQEFPDIIESEVLWLFIVDTMIRPKINISSETVAEIQKKEKKYSKDQIVELLVEQQIQGQSMQILESIRKISIIEFADVTEE